MDLNVSIDKVAIEQQVVRAITESAIGQNIEKAINKALTVPKGYGSGTLVEEAVQQVVSQEIRIAIGNALRDNEEFKKHVHVLVVEMTTDDVLRAIIGRVFTFDE